MVFAPAGDLLAVAAFDGTVTLLDVSASDPSRCETRLADTDPATPLE
jgi:hypothetical protein